MPPRPYQSAAIPAIFAAFRQHRRVLLTLATGGGKTWLASRIAAAAVQKGRRVLFLTDRRDLTQQAAGPLGASVIMGSETGDPDAPIITTTWQTYASRPVPLTGPWLLIVDEADRWAAGMHALLNDLPPNAKALLLTATPNRSARGEGMSEIADVLVSAGSPAELLDGGWLTPFDTFDIGRGEGRLDDPAAMDCAYVGWLPHAHRPSLGIATSAKHAHAAAELWRRRGHWAEVVLADTPDRDRLYAHLRAGHPGILWGVDVPGRGIDIPALSCLLVCRRLSSWSGIIQEQGRLTRLFRPCARCGDHIQWGRLDCWVCGHVHEREGEGWKPRGVLLDQAGNWTRAQLASVTGYTMDEPQTYEKGMTPARACVCGMVVPLYLLTCPACGEEMPPQSLKPAAVGEWALVGEDDRRWQALVEEARVRGYQPSWCWHRAGQPEDLGPLRRAIARLKPDLRRRWVETVHSRVDRVWMGARLGFR